MEEGSSPVRPIFFYNTPHRIGDELALHLFEPRYVLMIDLVMGTPHREFIYLASGAASAQVGDVGLIARITECEVEDDGRANILATITREVLISAHWVEPGSKGLAWCVCQAPSVEPYQTMDRAGQVRALNQFGRIRAACRTSRNGRYIVHTQRGFLNIHSSNDDPFDSTNILAQLQDSDVVILEEGTTLGLLPFCWARVAHPVPGWCVSFTGNFEWLEPEQPVFENFQIRMSLGSLCAVVVGTEPEIDAVAQKVCEATGFSRAELRLQGIVRPDASPVSVGDFAAAITSVVSPSGSFRTHMDAPEAYFKGLRVVEAFSMPVTNATARIAGILSRSETNGRLARSLVLTWIENFDNEMTLARTPLRSVWQRLTEAPDGDERGHPYCVTVSFGEDTTRMFVHRELCFLEGAQARRAVKAASFEQNWPLLRLMYVAARKESTSPFSHLPNEILVAIGTFVAPHMYIRNFGFVDR